MLTERYNYQPLERVSIEGSRHYQTPNGEPLPSVTTVLDALKDKTSLYEWRKRVGDEEANRITKLATGIGTQVHLHIENWCQKKSKVANSLGYVLLLFACSLTIYHFGWGSGIFTFSVILMTIASLVILLQPLHLITYKTLIPTVLFIFLIEFSLL